jgi:hypothetical protein
MACDVHGYGVLGYNAMYYRRIENIFNCTTLVSSELFDSYDFDLTL